MDDRIIFYLQSRFNVDADWGEDLGPVEEYVIYLDHEMYQNFGIYWHNYSGDTETRCYRLKAYPDVVYVLENMFNYTVQDEDNITISYMME